jgi:hypothetical protein
MTNPQNVDALTILILRYMPLPMPDNDVTALAKALSDAGVLVPSTLTDDQVRTLRAPSGLDRDPRSDAVIGAEVRAALIAIAKGTIE